MKLAFATDLHIGAAAGDFHQQTYWAGGHAQIVAALRSFLFQHDVDGLLLGGDMTHNTSPAEIAEFVALFQNFPTQIFLCLGNHDLCHSPTTDHMALWWAALDPHRNFTLAPLIAELPGVDLISFNVHWADAAGRVGLFWSKEACAARVAADHLAWLDDTLGQSLDRPAILMIHESLDALPPQLTGEPTPIHAPAVEYVAALSPVLDRHPRVRLVLTGHNHVTFAARHGRRVHLSTGSLSEYPCAVRLINLASVAITVTTHALLPAAPGVAAQTEKLWALGRESDRTLTLPV